MRINFIYQVVMGTLMLALCGWWALGDHGLPLFLGATWGAANLILIRQLTQQCYKAGKKNYLKIGILLLLKCPIIYIVGYFLLKSYVQSIYYLFAGFSLLLVALVILGVKENWKKRAGV